MQLPQVWYLPKTLEWELDFNLEVSGSKFLFTVWHLSRTEGAVAQLMLPFLFLALGHWVFSVTVWLYVSHGRFKPRPFWTQVPKQSSPAWSAFGSAPVVQEAPGRTVLRQVCFLVFERYKCRTNVKDHHNRYGWSWSRSLLAFHFPN